MDHFLCYTYSVMQLGYCIKSCNHWSYCQIVSLTIFFSSPLILQCFTTHILGSQTFSKVLPTNTPTSPHVEWEHFTYTSYTIIIIFPTTLSRTPPTMLHPWFSMYSKQHHRETIIDLHLHHPFHEIYVVIDQTHSTTKYISKH